MLPLFKRLFSSGSDTAKPAATQPASAQASVPTSAAETEAAEKLIAQGNAAEDRGDAAGACDFYRKAVAAAPGHARAHLNLGIGLAASGDAQGATQAYAAALALDPTYAPAHYNLATLFFAQGTLDEAGNHLRLALRHRPAFPEAYVALSNVYDAQGDLQSAIAALESALALNADYGGALYNYGGLLRRAGRFHEAEAALRRAAGVDPDNVEVRMELANLLRARGALPEAEQLLRSTLALRPADADLCATLFHVCESQGRLAEACAALELALALRPDWVGALNNYGNVLKKLRRMSEAETAYRRALAADPAYVATYRGLGGILIAQSRVAEARAVFQAGRKLDPQGYDLESAELYSLHLTDEFPAEVIAARHRAFGARLEAAVTARASSLTPDRNDDRPLRIAYLSADLYQHPVALFLLPLLERHDRTRFEAWCYSTSGVQDAMTRKLQAAAKVWREVGAMADDELASRISEDRIDILVDLTGHSGDFRPGVLARQPAPVQVTWLGYPYSTGTTRVQYRLTDAHTDPSGLADRCHSEKLLRLPHSQWCYRPPLDLPCAETPPAARNGYVTFASFNEFSKLSQSVRRLWIEILTRVPTARLAIARVSEGAARDGLMAEFTSAGVAAERIQFLPPVSTEAYYRRFGDIDIALDSAPYSGCTTTCDTLWMGAPLVTLAGELSPARSSASILTTVGLPQWIAQSPEEYVGLAVQLAGDPAAMAELRRTLRTRVTASPLMDEMRFARDVEQAYRAMWQDRHTQG